MRPVFAPSVAAASCLVLAGCTALGRAPEVRNRYRTADWRNIAELTENPQPDPDRAMRFRVSISSEDTPPAERGFPVTALSEGGQAAFVAAMAAYAKDRATLADALGRPIRAAEDAPGLYARRNRISRRLILSILPEHGPLPPGDRLSWTRVRITPVNASFAGWSIAFNAQDAIQVGSIKSTASQKLTAGTGIAPGAPLLNTTVSAENTRSREENAVIVDESSINARTEAKLGEIVEQGAWRQDLTGNRTFDATLEVDTPATASLYRLGRLWEDGAPRRPGQVVLARQQVEVPAEKPICATVQLEYEVRRVIRAQESFTEADDDVEFVRGRYDSPAPLRIAPIPFLPRWGVETPNQLIIVSAPGEGEDVLALPGIEAALDLIEWLKAVGPAGAKLAAGKRLLVMGASGPRPLERGDLETMRATLVSGGPALVSSTGAVEPLAARPAC